VFRVSHRGEGIDDADTIEGAQAIIHTVQKPGRGPIDNLIVYECEVPRNKLRRYGKGTWRCFEAVRPVSVVPAMAYAMNYPDNQPG
jgi:hypothetical protein